MTRYIGRSLLGVCGLAVVLALVASPAAAAGDATVAVQPAATLLLPYFEVDLGPVGGGSAPPSSCPPGSICSSGGGGGGGPAPLGINTIFTINNASATAVLAHVVVWSDLSVHVLDFNVYLTGYDMQVIDLREVLNANLPRTASDGQDPLDTISPQGDFSQDINFASCSGILPPPADLGQGFRDHLRASLTGQPSAFLAGCAGRAFGDNHARGYVTVDTVNNCTLRFPADPGYFISGGIGDATNQNVLWGDYAFSNALTGESSGGPLVHIAASATDPETSVPGEYTFYGRYVGWTAADNRQALPTSFATRYSSESPFTGTTLVAWRDSKVSQGAFTCPAVPGTRPPWYPLGQEGIVVFDEQENPVVPQVFPVSPQPPQTVLIPFPAEAQVVAVGGASLPTPFSSGWLYINLNTTVAPAGPNPPEDPAAAQGWIIAIQNTNGTFGGVAVPGIQLDSGSNARHFIP